jgi:LmbE family N-acetylglucosaminyl deacetylase
MLMLIGFISGYAQSDWYSQKWDEGKVNLELKKKLNPTKILYVAAHPDDENTRLIAYLENVLHAEVAYLSITNGMGGQNLISEEIGEELGLIREQELYAARRSDGGVQYFTTAQDFGYSKSHEETFKKWGKEKVLGEVVYRIRAFQPDIIITRFAPYTDGLRSTHGHHTASAMLALEAFTAAADQTKYTDQLDEVQAWQTNAIYWNTGYWSFGSQEKLDSTVTAEPHKYVKLSVESYVEELGLTVAEIAANSRSMHKSQGFGTMARYGETFEYLELQASSGEMTDYFKVNQTKKSAYTKKMEQAIAAKTGKANKIAKAIAVGKKKGLLSDRQISDLNELRMRANGLKVFLTATEPIVAKGDNELELNVVHFGAGVETIDLHQFGLGVFQVNPGELFTKKINVKLDADYKTPHFIVNMGDANLDIPLIYRTSDPVIGEIIQPVFVAEQVILEILQPELILINKDIAEVQVKITAVNDVYGQLVAKGNGATLLPHFKLKAGESIIKTMSLPQGDEIEIAFLSDAVAISKTVKTIKHNHIPWIYKAENTRVIVHQMEIKCTAKKVGYVMGAGDKGPEAIAALGVEVELLDYEKVSQDELAKFDAVVFGIRALNVLENIDNHIAKFYSYAENGGTLIMQYNTSHRLNTNQLQGLTLSRDRVTEEDAPVALNINTNKLVTTPNAMLEQDWKNWVQERGLYFPNAWPSNFEAPLKMNDDSEEALDGALLISPLGKGAFIYTGLSFFRELPAGVEGAYKLWANLLSYKP